MSILVSAFCMHSFLSILGTIPAPNQEWHHSAGIFLPRNVILAGLWAKIDSSGFRRNDQNLAGISGAWLRPPFFPDKAVGFAASQDWSSSHPFFDRCQERADCENIKAPSDLPTKYLTTSSCEMGWGVSKCCTMLSQSWSVRCSWTMLGLQMAEVQGASLFFGAWGEWGAYGLCPPWGFHFFSWVAGMEKCWWVWKLCSRGVFMAHRHIRVDFGPQKIRYHEVNK